jgi:hypothetical protein
MPGQLLGLMTVNGSESNNWRKDAENVLNGSTLLDLPSDGCDVVDPTRAIRDQRTAVPHERFVDHASLNLGRAWLDGGRKVDAVITELRDLQKRERVSFGSYRRVVVLFRKHARTP